MADAGARDAEVETAVGARARALRVARGLTLDGLAARSGVSRAMLSRIERGESSPTAGLLVRLCDGLGVTMTALLGGGSGQADGALARRTDQPVWRDPGSGYLRRTVSPAGTCSRVEIVEVEMPAGAAVVLELPDGAARDQHLWVLDGRLEMARGDAVLSLAPGDCILLPLGGPTGLRNAGPEAARCAVITGRAGDLARGG